MNIEYGKKIIILNIICVIYVVDRNVLQRNSVPVRRKAKIHGQRHLPVQGRRVLCELRRGRCSAVHGAFLFSRLGMEHMVGCDNAQDG